MNHFTSRLFYGILLSMAHATLSWAQTDTLPKIALGAFFDAYYAYDFERPATRDRAYTTQPARHNEFNINLAFVEAKIADERVRGRFALQTGTPNGFQIYGGSLTADVAVAPNLLWRLEGRLLSSKDGIYPTNDPAKFSERNGLVVTSLSITL